MTDRQAAENTHEAVRAWYKSQYKSSNKRYAQSLNSEKAVRRNQNAEQVNAWLRHTRAYSAGFGQQYPESKLYVMHGLALVNSNFRFGNCGEMTAVALYFLRIRMADANIAYAHLLEGSGDHAFAVVGDTSLPLTMFDDLATLQPNKDTFIVDPWANVFCDIKEYPAKFRKKMDDWTNQGKLVVNGRQTLTPNGLWMTQVAESKVHLIPQD
jgi:hypothetical protein